MFGKIKESIDKGIVSVSVKSGTYLEIEKLKVKIGNVQGEIEQLKSMLGNEIYVQWEKSTPDQDLVNTTCKKIQDKEGEIASYEQQITQLDQEKERILKGSGENQTVSDKNVQSSTPTSNNTEDKVLCACGGVNVRGAKFCRACGMKLSQAEGTNDQAEPKKLFCPVCNAEIEEDTRFCSECGAPV